MNSSDLRIGNWVAYNNDFFIIKTISKYRVTATRGRGDVEFDYTSIKPIELTEEILLKCGFEQELIKHQYSLRLITLQLPNENDYHKKGRVYYNSWAIKNECVEYLHQLQNLYFSLTNEELNVQL